MNSIINIETLLNVFLLRENIYKSYYEYIERDKPFWFGSSINKFCFNWGDTSEGYNFWENKYCEWVAFEKDYEALQYIPDLLEKLTKTF